MLVMSPLERNRTARWKHVSWWSNRSFRVRWYVLDAETTDLVAIHTDGNEQLSVMRFSVGGWSQVKSSIPKWTTCPRLLLSVRLQMALCWQWDHMITLFTCTPSPRKDASTADTGSAQWVRLFLLVVWHFNYLCFWGFFCFFYVQTFSKFLFQ